jgi:hypothetical protein
MSNRKSLQKERVMKKLSCFIAVLLCVAPVCEIAASRWYMTQADARPDRQRKVGDFKMVGRGKSKTVDLSNNVFYKPQTHRDKKKTKQWKLGDVIRVLRTKTKKEFVLINLRTGDTIGTRVTTLD